MMGKLLFGNVGGIKRSDPSLKFKGARIVHPELRRICEVRKSLHFVQDRPGTLKLEPSAKIDKLLDGSPGVQVSRVVAAFSTYGQI
jgi:hypothetical protein